MSGEGHEQSSRAAAARSCGAGEAGAAAVFAPKSSPRDTRSVTTIRLVAENQRLVRETTRLMRKLRRTEAILEVQKNSPRSWGSSCRQTTP
jgi:hypothetical protein